MPWSNESRQSRGYDAEWEKVRKQVIEHAKGLCEKCAREGKVAMGRDVDHVVSKARAKVLGWSRARTDSITNLQYLCPFCHKEKTAAEQGRALRPAKVQIGLDGWPVESDNAK